ncbi:hypothetical protein ACLM5J_06715 [Nocardioides sp. Bht2]|uniref:hypothetical protein n=1 Tax=Nocardioides sp. Bht2 TaxID=3392297 RepID=UPI0039B53E9F
MIRAMPLRDEDGSAMVEFVWLAILLLVPLVYLLLSTFEVQRGAFGVSAASRAAGRAFTLADSPEEGRRRARTAAAIALRDQGISDFELEISCRPQPCLSPGSVASVVVRAQVQLPLLPDALGGGSPSFAVTSTHRVPSGRYIEASRE